MKIREYFPLGIASGQAFCNREIETQTLINNIQNGQHTVIISPRRYGKTSLAQHALHLSNIPYCKVDFFIIVDERTIEKLILSSINTLIGEIFGSTEKILAIMQRYVKKLKPTLSVSANGPKIELSPSASEDPSHNILEALLIFENMLREKKQMAVIFFDEFQEISLVEKRHGIEAAIRSVAQESQQLSFIFSGSNRHLLSSMFEDKKRPLYKLCKKIQLERISKQHYYKHLNVLAKRKWKALLPNDTFESIMTFSEYHPYYVNNICEQLWTKSDNLPQPEDVKLIWNWLIKLEKSEVAEELASLSLNQKKVMVAIANDLVTGLTSKDFLNQSNMASSSVIRAIESLVKKDLIILNDDKLSILDHQVFT